MKVLSIQSSVAYGHVGNSAATFPLMRMGVEVYPVLTVHFSNHTGYGEWRGPLLAAADVLAALVAGQHRLDLGKCAALLHALDHRADVVGRQQRAAPLAVPGVVGEVHRVHRPHLDAEPLQREHRGAVADMAVGDRGLDREDAHGVDCAV